MSGRVLVVGNFLSAFGLPRGICEEFAERLAGSGWQVETTSHRVSRPRRLVDMVSTAWRRRFDYDVAQVDVYSGNAFLWAELVCATLSKAGKPYVLTLHGGNLPRFARRWPRRVRRLLRSASCVTSPSPYLATQLGAFREILVLPNPLSLESYPFRLRREPRPRLVWLRAFHRIYDPTLAVKVVERLAPEFPDVHLTMIGADKADGSLEAARTAAVAAGVASRISFCGPVPKREVASLLAASDLFLNTSRVDNAPMSVLEAMACGLPVVSTDAGGVPDLVRNGEDALLVPVGDPDAMADAVRRILTSPDLAEGLSRRGRATAECLDWSHILPRWEELLTQTASRSAAGESSFHPISREASREQAR